MFFLVQRTKYSHPIAPWATDPYFSAYPLMGFHATERMFMPSSVYNEPLYSTENKPLLQALLSTLADMDFVHDCEIERVSKTASTCSSVRASLLDKLWETHHQRREPYVRQISLLQYRQQTEPTLKPAP